MNNRFTSYGSRFVQLGFTQTINNFWHKMSSMHKTAIEVSSYNNKLLGALPLQDVTYHCRTWLTTAGRDLPLQDVTYHCRTWLTTAGRDLPLQDVTYHCRIYITNTAAALFKTIHGCPCPCKRPTGWNHIIVRANTWFRIVVLLIGFFKPPDLRWAKSTEDLVLICSQESSLIVLLPR